MTALVGHGDASVPITAVDDSSVYKFFKNAAGTKGTTSDRQFTSRLTIIEVDASATSGTLKVGINGMATSTSVWMHSLAPGESVVIGPEIGVESIRVDTSGLGVSTYGTTWTITGFE